MKNIMKKANDFATRQAIKMKLAVSNNKGEGYIDTAVFPVQDDYDRMNTIQKIKYQIIREKFKLINKLNALFRRTRFILADQRGQTALDQVVAILISIVLGSLLLAGLYALFSNILLPAIQERVMDIFDYAG